MLVLSQHADERYALDLIGDSAEGVGYLLKDRVADFAAFADAVRRVAEGGSALDPDVVSRMLGRRRRADPVETLTPREREVLELMGEGRSNRGIAEVLVVTPAAVEKHVTSIFSKLGIAQATGGPPPGARGADVPAPLTMPETGKRVSWVELYLDLVFVLAVGRLAHLMVAEPRMHSVWIALGLFFVLWWTWVGFAVLYNRHGADEPNQRFLFLLASIPAGVAAVAIEPVSKGDVAVFAASLAVIRLILAFGYVVAEGGTDILRRRITRACLASAALFAVSIAVPEPFRYLLWLVAIGIESSTMLAEDREAMGRARRDRDLSALAPADPEEALDAHHFAERFGLFLIILLGEVLVEAGQAAVTGADADAGRWAALVAAMTLAAALWWLYFDSAVEINLKVLELTGGSTTMARAIFAVGHMLPSFALLVIAAGVGLLLEEEPPRYRRLGDVHRDRHVPARHARVPAGRRPRERRGAGAHGRRDVQPRAAVAAPVAARVPVAAHRLDRRLRHPDDAAGPADGRGGARRDDGRTATPRTRRARARAAARAPSRRRGVRRLALGGDRDHGPHERAAPRRALDLEAAVERADAVGQAAQARARGRVRPTAAVVADLDDRAAVETLHVDSRVRRAGVLGDVRQRLGDDVVGRRLDRQRQALVERVAELDRARASASRATRSRRRGRAG